MEQRERGVYKILATMTGKDAQDVEIQMERSLDRIVRADELIVISESFSHLPPSSDTKTII